MENVLLRLSKIQKYFPGVHALKDASLELRKGEVHALMGENGAGKSTLMKILLGVLKSDGGEIYYDGQVYTQMNVRLAEQLGIGMIYQELNLVPFLTVTENIFLGREYKKNGLIQNKLMEEETRKIFEELGVSIDCNAKVKDITIAYQQIVEIAKAISKKCKLIVMDEPTGPLAKEEVELLFKLIEKLKAQGVSIIYISHRMEEIFRICDRITVFRDGQYIEELNVKDTTKEELIKLMVGRDMEEQYPLKVPVEGNDYILEVSNLKNDKLKDISLKIKEGEIFGIAGLVGAGRTEFARAIYGADEIYSGEIKVNGKIVKISHPWDGIENGIVLLPEDRKQQGLLLKMSVEDNIVIPSLSKLRKKVFIDNKKIKEEVKKLIQDLYIKTPSEKQIVKNLSGGNQQKVVIAKWILSNADIIIFDEPTRGIDVGAKYEIYCLMNELKKQGKTVIMISSDMLELIGMSDRVGVMCNGRITGILENDDINQENIMTLAADF